ncbi:MAG: exodeoxyribonuclease V subunit alpha [Telluria sp.]
MDQHDAFHAEAARLVEAGAVRRLSAAFARFVAGLGPAPAPLLLACVALSELEGRGHSCLLLDDLHASMPALLGWEAEQWRTLAATCAPLPKSGKAWADVLTGAGQVWDTGGFDFGQPLVLDGQRLYLRRYWSYEALVAEQVNTRARAPQDCDPQRVRGWIDLLFAAAQRKSEGPDWQKLACAMAVRSRVSVITGGPGTGKTYTVARLLALLFAMADDPAHQRIALAAPTGKAAARLKQSIDKALGDLADKVGDALPLRALAARMGAARTLHSLLGARPGTRAFAHHRGNPLDVDVLIVDEASMVHLEMMAALLDALPPTAALVLLGDKDQLASVEAGAVLGDLCHEAQLGGYTPATLAYAAAATGEAIPPQFAGSAGPLAQATVMLRESRRFGGPIGRLALAVNAGDAAQALAILREGAEVSWQERATQQAVVALAVEGYRPYLDLLRAAPGDATAILRAFEAFRILCATREGEYGVEGLNDAIAVRLDTAGLLARRGEWYAGRPVMVTRNDYATGVFNGDIGITLPDPGRPGSLRVYFLEGEEVRSVLATRLRDVETAFAMTVHKSQGSEFANTVMVLPRERSAVLARELIYTGITRASKRFTLMSWNAVVLEEAIATRTHRASGLRARLQG